MLPSLVREQLDLRTGDPLVLVVEDSGEMRLVSLRRQIERCMGMFKDLAPPGRLLSEELIAERRQEALREDQRGAGNPAPFWTRRPCWRTYFPQQTS